jgi:hypothetical protein
MKSELGVVSTSTAVSKSAQPMPVYKYAASYAQIQNCPCTADTSFAETSFHIVKAKIDHPKNFLPRAKRDPKSLQKVTTAEELCKSWALSMFEKAEQLKAHILKVERHAPMFRKRVGDHGVELTISAKHGRRTGSTGNGHFTFFEYSQFDASQAIVKHFPLFT